MSKRINTLFIGVLCALLATFSAQAEGLDGRSVLARQLVEGTPWRLSTSREYTEHRFRFGANGSLEHLRGAQDPGVIWVEVEAADAESFAYSTTNGHRITFSLDSDGRPRVDHSKHSAVLKSIKASQD